ncbi:MAG: cytochrome oxidase assembly protein [Thaumarchaeota archaeon]|nr:MAG: cytochrome oxidase assembly protein [Nitrososphaerota archaeon]TLX85840.1 MAG: cytochrome oxidase assembly protein [Nitrososphaerota archaeon]TLX90282.1 MAG: cytochrome oxidase assembly protein [Nitrososphaerota archaeon]
MFLAKLSFSTLFVVFALIFIGGYVGSSGVGLSCPEWPLCPAGLVPMKEFIIEYFHRTVAATTGVMVFATMLFTLRSRETSKSTKIASMIAAGLVVGQITLGAIVIVEKLHALLVTVHLGMGLILFLMILTVTLDVNKFFKKQSENKMENLIHGRPSDVEEPTPV